MILLSTAETIEFGSTLIAALKRRYRVPERLRTYVFQKRVNDHDQDKNVKISLQWLTINERGRGSEKGEVQKESCESDEKQVHSATNEKKKSKKIWENSMDELR